MLTSSAIDQAICDYMQLCFDSVWSAPILLFILVAVVGAAFKVLLLMVKFRMNNKESEIEERARLCQRERDHKRAQLDAALHESVQEVEIARSTEEEATMKFEQDNT